MERREIERAREREKADFPKFIVIIWRVMVRRGYFYSFLFSFSGVEGEEEETGRRYQM